MKDCIKSERVRKIISQLVGKIVMLTDDTGSREKIVTGIYGVGDVPSMGQLCMAFSADYQKDDGGAAGAQISYEEWEELIETGKTGDPEWLLIEMV